MVHRLYRPQIHLLIINETIFPSKSEWTLHHYECKSKDKTIRVLVDDCRKYWQSMPQVSDTACCFIWHLPISDKTKHNLSFQLFCFICYFDPPYVDWTKLEAKGRQSSFCRTRDVMCNSRQSVYLLTTFIFTRTSKKNGAAGAESTDYSLQAERDSSWLIVHAKRSPTAATAQRIDASRWKAPRQTI